jgi:AraC-like DNA-binding protein
MHIGAGVRENGSVSGRARPREPQVTLRTTRLDEAVEAVGAAYFPHRLTMLGPTADLDMALDSWALGPLTVGTLRYGADVEIQCGELITGYEVNVPLTGRLDARNGTRAVSARPGQAGIYLPTGRTTIDLFSADCTILAVKLERKYVEQELEQMLDRPVRRPVRMAPTIDVTRGPGRTWHQLVQIVHSQLQARDPRAAPPALTGHLCAALTCGLLLAASDDCAEELGRPAVPERPGPISRAVELIEARYAEPLTVVDLARAARTSVRRLQAGFQAHFGLTPMAYLRQYRLRQAHRRLASGEPGGATVTDVALTCGFRHLGRFAADYHRRYGRTPSDTLRRPRAQAAPDDEGLPKI